MRKVLLVVVGQVPDLSLQTECDSGRAPVGAPKRLLSYLSGMLRSQEGVAGSVGGTPSLCSQAAASSFNIAVLILFYF